MSVLNFIAIVLIFICLIIMRNMINSCCETIDVLEIKLSLAEIEINHFNERMLDIENRLSQLRNNHGKHFT